MWHHRAGDARSGDRLAGDRTLCDSAEMATAEQASTLIIEPSESIVTITMNRPERRNSLSLDHLVELTEAFRAVSATDARGIVLAANGPVF